MADFASVSVITVAIPPEYTMVYKGSNQYPTLVTLSHGFPSFPSRPRRPLKRGKSRSTPQEVPEVILARDSSGSRARESNVGGVCQLDGRNHPTKEGQHDAGVWISLRLRNRGQELASIFRLLARRRWRRRLGRLRALVPAGHSSTLPRSHADRDTARRVDAVSVVGSWLALRLPSPCHHPATHALPANLLRQNARWRSARIKKTALRRFSSISSHGRVGSEFRTAWPVAINDIRPIEHWIQFSQLRVHVNSDSCGIV